MITVLAWTSLARIVYDCGLEILKKKVRTRNNKITVCDLASPSPLTDSTSDIFGKNQEEKVKIETEWPDVEYNKKPQSQKTSRNHVAQSNSSFQMWILVGVQSRCKALTHWKRLHVLCQEYSPAFPNSLPSHMQHRSSSLWSWLAVHKTFTSESSSSETEEGDRALRVRFSTLGAPFCVFLCGVLSVWTAPYMQLQLSVVSLCICVCVCVTMVALFL